MLEQVTVHGHKRSGPSRHKGAFFLLGYLLVSTVYGWPRKTQIDVEVRTLQSAGCNAPKAGLGGAGFTTVSTARLATLSKASCMALHTNQVRQKWPAPG